MHRVSVFFSAALKDKQIISCFFPTTEVQQRRLLPVLWDGFMRFTALPTVDVAGEDMLQMKWLGGNYQGRRSVFWKGSTS